MTVDFKRKLWLVAWISFVLAVVATVLPACLGLAEEPAPAVPEAPAAASSSGHAQVGSWQYTMEAMGLVGIILVLQSVAGLALIIEFAVNLRKQKMIPPHVVAELENLIEQEQYEQAIQVCDSEDCFFTRIVGSGLDKLGGSYQKMIGAVQEGAEREITRVNQRLGLLALIGTIAPMFGLLGTVTGMIMAFNVIAQKAGTANPADLAYGISQALINTLLGLVIAIPVLTAYTLFKNRVALLVMEAGTITGEMLERFRPTEQQ
jgi:biopolymer transport protein ExbB